MTVGELMEALEQSPRDAQALVTCPFDGGWSWTSGAVAVVARPPGGAVVIAAQEKAGRERVEEAAVAQALDLARRSLRTGPG